jgi:hypothetical protein
LVSGPIHHNIHEQVVCGAHGARNIVSIQLVGNLYDLCGAARFFKEIILCSKDLMPLGFEANILVIQWNAFRLAAPLPLPRSTVSRLLP